MNQKSTNLPDNTGNGADGARGEDFRALRIDQLHYHANDLSELRKLADGHPELAREVLRMKDGMDRRENNSFRIGVIATTAVALALIFGTCWIVIKLGWWQSFIFIFCMLAAGHFLRVVLTGEWSDTSWIGKLIGLVTKKKPSDPTSPSGSPHD